MLGLLSYVPLLASYWPHIIIAIICYGVTLVYFRKTLFDTNAGAFALKPEEKNSNEAGDEQTSQNSNASKGTFWTYEESLARSKAEETERELQRQKASKAAVEENSKRRNSSRECTESGRQTPEQHQSGEAAPGDGDESDYDEPTLHSLHSHPEDGIRNVPMVEYKPELFSEEDMLQRSKDFFDLMNKRRSVRVFSSRPVKREIIENIIKTAGTSPSGAHTEPWTFVVISNQEMKKKIRDVIEDEEEINYKKRMGYQWVADLEPLRTNWIKEYLTEAPYLILQFKQLYSTWSDGTKKNHYYNELSVAISAGFLLAAIQASGLVSLTSTPLNCGPAIREMLQRPKNEKLVMLFPVGYAADDAKVPDLKRKPIDDIMISFD